MRERWAFWIGMLALSTLSVRAIWIVPYLPTNDGPQNILSAHIENHYSDPGSIYASTLVPAPQFAYKGFAAIFGPLESALGWRDGLRVALAILVLGVAWAFAGAVIALEPRRRWLGYLGFVLAWMWPLYMGFFAFVAGTAIGLGALAYALRTPKFGTKAAALVGGILLLGAIAHVFTATLMWGVIVLVILARADRTSRWGDFARVGLAGLPALALLALTAAVHDVDTNAPRFVPFAKRVEVLARLVAPGPAWRAWVVVAVLAGAAALVATRVRALRRDERALLAAGITFITVGVLAPRDVKNWQFFSPRFLPLGAMLVLLVTPVERVRAGLLEAASFVLTAGSLLVTGTFHRALAAGCADAIDGLSAPVARTGTNLPIVLDSHCGVSADPARSEVPYMAPLYHVGALYAAVQGGSTAYLFIGSSAAHAFKARPGGIKIPVPDGPHYRPILASRAFHEDPTYRRSVLLELVTLGSAAEGILVAGARPEDRALLEEQGFAIDYARGTFAIAHFVPCSAEIEAPAAPGRPLWIDAGGGDIGLDLVAIEARPAVADEAGRVRVALTRAPCGESWVRVRAPVQRPDGSFAESVCTNARADGRIPTRIARTGATVVCEAFRD
jgi:hypothetical protein